ncbi:MAG: hypothetical protein EYC68_16265 [Chloroflexota bacterium]|nr:MAG: hypothetical protein EYC68_16265 [Chloroflexota bacterium]
MFNRKEPLENMDAYVEERLSAYLDGTLSDKERKLVEAHLALSEHARASLESLRYTVTLLKQTPPPPLPRQFTLPVTTRAPAQSAPGWLVWGLRGVAVAATAAFVVLLLATLIRPPQTNESTAMAPAAVPAQPSVVVALASTPLPTFGTMAQDSTTNPSPTQIMVTATAANEIQKEIPVTETPASVQQQESPSQSDNAQVEAPTEPAPAPATRAPKNAQPQPTTIAATSESSAASSALESNLTPAPANAEGANQRAFVVAPLEGQVIVRQLKVREGPGVEYPVIGTVRDVELVIVRARSQDDLWLWIDYPKNRKTGRGWISRAYVTLNGALETLPIVDPVTLLEITMTPTPTPTETQTISPTESSPHQTPGTPDATPDPNIATPLPNATSSAEATPVTATPATQATESSVTATPTPLVESDIARGGIIPKPSE